jgi:hypothetical protein
VEQCFQVSTATAHTLNIRLSSQRYSQRSSVTATSARNPFIGRSDVLQARHIVVSVERAGLVRAGLSKHTLYFALSFQNYPSHYFKIVAKYQKASYRHTPTSSIALPTKIFIRHRSPTASRSSYNMDQRNSILTGRLLDRSRFSGFLCPTLSTTPAGFLDSGRSKSPILCLPRLG